MKKLLLLIALQFTFYEYLLSEDKLPSIAELCINVEYEIKDLELMKKNLKNEFKKKGNELDQFELLPELTKDINETVKQQILQAKLYHYLECSRF
ncbi:MAG: hypothetical protein CFH34_00162 [Alphaproteobacteria bacterium MarineAlpha9_Bin4]|nr:hypothetical protein [Pelagibacterales bacterium]PPR27449.1 MAG: hypothetical protein CFH34_00162 [Alphaproteobacteria bacterium MarineAlpha9_Bin4]|tara:strand:+ start:666 stop:950 length:285 start_codon:yes stop_codon:yes gene_type:complete